MALRKVLGSLLLVVAASACNCGPDVLQRHGSTSLTIDSPTEGQNFAPSDTIDLHVTATNPAGIKHVVLTVGSALQKADCAPTTDVTKVVCEAKFTANDIDIVMAKLLVQGQLTLEAQAQDSKDNVNKAQVTVNIRALHIVFVDPGDSTANPPETAEVAGTGPLTVKVTHASPLSKVTVLYDGNNVLQNFPNPGTGTVFSQMIAWTTKPGSGVHHLVASAMDENGNVDSAKLDVNVGCNADSDCASGNRCCTDNHTCNPIVGAGADCDCTHPCPLNQGCFPGTCGATPAQCRPGCFPGSDTQVADPCPQQPLNGMLHTAYCTQLPAGQANSENKGGACAPADDCDVVKQDCPDLPLDRTKPVSSTNPAVPHTCVPASPASPKANECIPAGKTVLGGTGCDLACGNNTTNCAKGLICVTPVDSSGMPTGPAACQKQCSTPWTPSFINPTPPQARDCAAHEYCGGLEGAGQAPFATGVCEPM